MSHVFGMEGDYVLWPSNPNLWRSEVFSNLTPREIKGKNSKERSVNCRREMNLYVADYVCISSLQMSDQDVSAKKEKTTESLLPDLLSLFPIFFSKFSPRPSYP